MIVKGHPVIEIHFVSIHKPFIDAYSQFGTFRAAKEKNLAHFKSHSLRDFTQDKHGTVDDRPYGGGDGMVMKPEPLAASINHISKTSLNPYVIFPSPSGKIFDQQDAQRLLKLERPLVFVCGRFGGVDQRFIEHYVDEEISCGNFIVSGGELPSLMIADALLRFVPGVLGNSESSFFDSFSEGANHMLEAPLYTRPRSFENLLVPETLLSGNHSKILKWQLEKSIQKTKQIRPDLIDVKIQNSSI